jgi:hypothetical protein
MIPPRATVLPHPRLLEQTGLQLPGWANEWDVKHAVVEYYSAFLFSRAIGLWQTGTRPAPPPESSALSMACPVVISLESIR